jgi:hypothetical protein
VSMSYYKKNCEVLGTRWPVLLREVQNSGTNSIIPCDTKNGDRVPLITIQQGKRPVAVHSKFDPQKEAVRFIDGVDTKTHNLFVVIGFGYGYHVQQLLAHAAPDALVLVVERDYEMIRSALTERDLTQLLSDERLILLVDPDEDKIATALQGRSSRSVAFVTHRGSFQIDQDYYSNISRIMKSYLSSKEVNIATLAKFEKLWTLNCAKNSCYHVSRPGAGIFYDRFSKVAGVVIGAGPSLRDSLQFLKENQNSMVLIALDTSYKILLDYGIEPHFCCCVDPQLINARYFEGVPHTKTILVADPTVHPSVFRLFRGRSVVCSMPFDTMKWLEEYTGEKGEIAHGGSVSTNAYDFAKRLGLERIYLVGQDLSFTDRLAHCRGSYLDEMVFLRCSRFFNQEIFNRRQLTALPKILVPALDGSEAHTNQKMIIFQKWFEKRGDPALINATSRGVRLRGIEECQTSQIDESASFDIRSAIDALLTSAQISDEDQLRLRAKISDRITLLQNENGVVMDRIESAVRIGERLVTALRKRSKEVGSLVSKLDSLDEFIASKSSTKSMIGMSIQRIIHTITEGYNTDEEGSNDHEKIAQRSLFLYRGLLEGCRFADKVLHKSRHVLEAALPDKTN